MYPSRPRRCLRLVKSSGPCHTCGQHTTTPHVPRRSTNLETLNTALKAITARKGIFCPNCCPACHPPQTPCPAHVASTQPPS